MSNRTLKYLTLVIFTLALLVWAGVGWAYLNQKQIVPNIESFLMPNVSPVASNQPDQQELIVLIRNKAEDINVSEEIRNNLGILEKALLEPTLLASGEELDENINYTYWILKDFPKEATEFLAPYQNSIPLKRELSLGEEFGRLKETQTLYFALLPSKALMVLTQSDNNLLKADLIENKIAELSNRYQ